MGEGIKDGLDAGVDELRSAGWEDAEIIAWITGEVHDYNQSGRANPHLITIGELNKYLSGLMPPISEVDGDENDVV